MSMNKHQFLKHSDGSWKCGTPADRAAEDIAAAKIAQSWNCNVVRFPEMHAVDFY